MIESDRELLELAAKAAFPKSLQTHAGYIDGVLQTWNPLVDDGDAFRLAVLIGADKTLVLTIGCGGVACEIPRPKHVTSFEQHSKHDYDQLAATRLAIVRCAAEIGKRVEV
jgi:hypothetical protein